MSVFGSAQTKFDFVRNYLNWVLCRKHIIRKFNDQTCNASVKLSIT